MIRLAIAQAILGPRHVVAKRDKRGRLVREDDRVFTGQALLIIAACALLIAAALSAS